MTLQCMVKCSQVKNGVEKGGSLHGGCHYHIPEALYGHQFTECPLFPLIFGSPDVSFLASSAMRT